MRRVSLILAFVMIVSLVVPLTASAAPAQSYSCHWVQYGENLFRIGLRYGVSAAHLAAANGLPNVNYVRAGTCLLIPGQVWYAPPYYTYPCTYGHRVAPGENLYRISLRYGVNMWSVAAINGIYDLNRIYAGQCLAIP